MHINVSGTQHNMGSAWTNVLGTWRTIKAAWVNVGGVWRIFAGFLPTVIDTISTSGCLSIALNKTTNMLYVGTGGNGVITVINLNTFSVVATISLTIFGQVDLLVCNSTTNKVYAYSDYSNTLFVIDGNTNAITNTVAVLRDSATGGAPLLAVNEVTNTVFVARPGNTSYLTIIDGSTNAIIASKTLSNSGTDDMKINSTANKVYISFSTSPYLTVIDCANGYAVSNLSIGNKPFAIGVNKVTNTIYLANWNDGTISVMNGATNSLITTIATGQSSPWTIAVNEVTNKAYVGNAGSSSISVINGSTNTLVTVIVTVEPIANIVIDSVTNFVYATHSSGTKLSVINGATNSIITVVTLTNPSGSSGRMPIVANESTNYVFVGDTRDNNVEVINGAT